MAVFGSGGSAKVGSIVIGSATPIDGFLLCDGSAVSRELYSDLFSVIGTQYGEGDSSTTFNLPLFNGTSSVSGTGMALGFEVNGLTYGANGQGGSPGSLQLYSNSYGAQSGESIGGGYSAPVGCAYGVAPDATKSGLSGNSANTPHAATMFFYIKY